MSINVLYVKTEVLCGSKQMLTELLANMQVIHNDIVILERERRCTRSRKSGM